MRDEWQRRWDHWFHESLPGQAWIEVVGSGGKTTLIECLARLFAAAGRRVVITTSTHMYPIPGLWQTFGEADCRPGEVIQLGTLGKQGKLEALSEQERSSLTEIADIVLVEADGSKRLPLKFPAAHEPVLSDKRTHTIIVQGMSALGESAAAVCHRYELVGQISADLFSGGMVTIADMAQLVRIGYRRVYEQGRTAVLLNQADMVPEVEREDLLETYRRYVRGTGLMVEMTDLQAGCSEENRPQIGLVLMASGYSRRFGENKLLYEVDGRPLAEHALRLMRSVMRLLWMKQMTATACVVSRQEWLRDRAAELGLRAVDNPYSDEGIAASIRIGTQEVCSQGAKKILFLVADQPKLSEDTVWRLIDTALTGERGLVIPQCNGRSGNPCIFDHCYREELLALHGEQGGKTVIRRHPADCGYVNVAEEDLADIDNKEQIEADK